MPGATCSTPAAARATGRALLAEPAARGAASGSTSTSARSQHARDAYGRRQRSSSRPATSRSCPSRTRAFDVVTCFETIEHVGAQREAVAELARVLRPGRRAADLLAQPRRVSARQPVPRAGARRPRSSRRCSGSAFAHVQPDAPAQLDRERGARRRGLRTGDAAAEDLDLRAGKLVGKQPGEELYTLAVCGHSQRGGARAARAAHPRARGAALDRRARPPRRRDRRAAAHAAPRRRAGAAGGARRALDRDGAARAPGVLARARPDRPRRVDAAPAAAARVHAVALVLRVLRRLRGRR